MILRSPARQNQVMIHTTGNHINSMIPVQAVPDSAAPAPAMPQPKQYLYEPRFGLPVVRRQLSYVELLKSIRQGKVKSVSWFKADHKGAAVVDGPCLVEFIDGTLYQSNVPMEEIRCVPERVNIDTVVLKSYTIVNVQNSVCYGNTWRCKSWATNYANSK